MSENSSRIAANPALQSVITDAEKSLTAYQQAASLSLKEVFQATGDIARECDELRKERDGLLRDKRDLSEDLERVKRECDELKIKLEKVSRYYVFDPALDC